MRFRRCRRAAAWLFVEVVGRRPRRDDRQGPARSAADCGARGQPRRHRRRPAAAQLWRIRADGAGLAGRSPAGLPAHAGWEDAAVPPAMLGNYLRDFDALMDEFGVTGLPYGHFGDGCMHVRIDCRSTRPGGRPHLPGLPGRGERHSSPATADPCPVSTGTAAPAANYLPLMYSPDAMELFAAVKHVFDPDNILNPGVLVDPRPGRRGPAHPRRATPAPQPGPGLPPRRRRLHPGGAPLHRRRQMPGRQHRHRGRDVPVVSGDAGGEGLHPRPRPRAAGDGQRHRLDGRAGDRRRFTTPSTCVCPARAAPRTAPPASTWPRTNPRCCTRATRAASAPPRTTRWDGFRVGRSIASHAPGLVNATMRASRHRTAGAVVGRSGQAPHHSDRSRSRRSGPGSSATETERATTGDPVLLFVDSFTNHFTPEVGHRHRAGPRGRRLPAAIDRQAAVLRSHLDLHRAARPRRRRSSAAPWTHCPVAPRPGMPDRRNGAVVHGLLALGRRWNCSAGRRPGRSPTQPAPSPNC